MEAIKPTITAKGFRTAVKDYTEESVIEELAANSYDEKASTVLVLLDGKSNMLYVIDDGVGFNDQSIKDVTTLGGGDKAIRQYSEGQRVYLGSYGYGLKSSLNIANKVEIQTSSTEGLYTTTIDWTILEEALRPAFKGYPCKKIKRPSSYGYGSIIKLSLASPTTKTHLDRFGKVLSNLPSDGGSFKCFYGFYEDVRDEVNKYSKSFQNLGAVANILCKKNRLKLASSSFDSELGDCEVEEISDKDDKTVVAKIYFAGMPSEKVNTLKESLRGIYVRVHGRLLKHNFSEDKYTYGISKYQMFKQGLRVELSIDWLRNQITLSRDGIKFSNEKLEKEFKSLIGRLIGRFIRPKIDKIQKKKTAVGSSKLKQRMELAKKRTSNNKGVLIKGISGGFIFKPETDAELAILLSQERVINKIDKGYKLVDYNDQASFDCMIYNSARREFIYTELEPTLMEFLEHNEKAGIELVVTWALGKWRTGAKKKGKGGFFELIQHPNKKTGNYKLLEYSSEKTQKPRADYRVIVLEELL